MHGRNDNPEELTLQASDAIGPALWLTLTLGISFAMMWSSAFAVAKILVTHTPPFTILFLRFILAGLIAGSIALLMGQTLPRGRAVWRFIIILGVCQNTLYLGLYFAAMTRIPAGLAAIIASSMPLIVAALAPMITSERVGGWKLAGLLAGFAGVVWIMVGRIAGGIDLFGLTLTIIGVLALSIATLTVKRGEFGTGLLMIVACQMLIGGLACLPIALMFEDVTDITINPAVIMAFAYQVTIPGIAATLIWFTLVKRVSTAGASAFHFLNPVFGTAFAWALLGEALSWSDSIGVALVAAGILLVNSRMSSGP